MLQEIYWEVRAGEMQRAFGSDAGLKNVERERRANIR
jgi:hypothetical protein